MTEFDHRDVQRALSQLRAAGVWDRQREVLEALRWQHGDRFVMLAQKIWQTRERHA